MCGRFTLTVATFDELCALLGLPPGIDPDAAKAFRPRYNVAPTDTHIILREDGRRHLAPAVWGFGTDKPGINARSETADSRPTFRSAFAQARCVVPADGFFEWTADGQPIWFHRKDGGLLLMAGLYHKDEGLRFTILTTAANERVAQVHDRMPAILAPEQLDAWLGKTPISKLRQLLAPAPADWLIATEVSPRVNSVKNDDAGCLEALPPAKPKQLRLF